MPAGKMHVQTSWPEGTTPHLHAVCQVGTIMNVQTVALQMAGLKSDVRSDSAYRFFKTLRHPIFQSEQALNRTKRNTHVVHGEGLATSALCD